MRGARIVPRLVVANTMDFRPLARGARLAADHRTLRRTRSAALVAAFGPVVVAAVLGAAHTVGQSPCATGVRGGVGTGSGAAQRGVLGNGGTDTNQGRIGWHAAARVGSRGASTAATPTGTGRAGGAGRTAAAGLRRTPGLCRAAHLGRAACRHRAASACAANRNVLACVTNCALATATARARTGTARGAGRGILVGVPTRADTRAACRKETGPKKNSRDPRWRFKLQRVVFCRQVHAQLSHTRRGRAFRSGPFQLSRRGRRRGRCGTLRTLLRRRDRRPTGPCWWRPTSVRPDRETFLVERA